MNHCALLDIDARDAEWIVEAYLYSFLANHTALNMIGYWHDNVSVCLSVTLCMCLNDTSMTSYSKNISHRCINERKKYFKYPKNNSQKIKYYQQSHNSNGSINSKVYFGVWPNLEQLQKKR